MKLIRILGIILAVSCLDAVQAQSLPDTMWAYKNYLPDSLWQYFNIYLCDTNTFPNVGCFDTVDTGKEFDGPYINFNYQFTDTVENNTLGSEGPGYAAFKIYWDQGNTKFDATYYDSMVLWHVGPLSGHKVDLVWGQGGACGGPINYQYLGSFKSSATWTKVVLPFPRGFIRNGIFQLNVLIHDDSGTTSLTSAKGCLKLSDIGFIKIHSAPTAPVPLTPANGAGGQGTTLNLTWSEGYFADSFCVVVAKDTGFSSTVFYQGGLIQQSVLVANLQHGATYYWHANATNPLGTSAWSSKWSFIILPAEAAPVLVSPGNGAMGISLSPALSWNSSPGATLYGVQVASVSNFSSTIFYQNSLTATTVTVGPLSYAATYFWEANASNAGGTGNWSSIWSFATVPAPPPGVPSLVSPTNGARSNSSSPILTWSSSASVVSYRLQVALASDFSNIVFDQAGITASSMEVSGFQSGKTIYWRVNASNTTGTSIWSNAWSLTISLPAVLPRKYDALSKSLSVSGSYLKYALPASSVVSIILYDLQGKPVRKLAMGLQGAGSYEISLMDMKLRADCYILEFKAGNYVVQRKFLFER